MPSSDNFTVPYWNDWMNWLWNHVLLGNVLHELKVGPLCVDLVDAAGAQGVHQPWWKTLIWSYKVWQSLQSNTIGFQNFIANKLKKKHISAQHFYAKSGCSVLASHGPDFTVSYITGETWKKNTQKANVCRVQHINRWASLTQKVTVTSFPLLTET
jgi:hypothetical protein